MDPPSTNPLVPEISVQMSYNISRIMARYAIVLATSTNKSLVRHDIVANVESRLTDKLIGRGGPIAWLPRSLELNHKDFFVWGY